MAAALTPSIGASAASCDVHNLLNQPVAASFESGTGMSRNMAPGRKDMSTHAPSRQASIVTTVVAAVTAAAAAAGSLTLSLHIWAMFIGWIAYFTRVGSNRTAVGNLVCVGLGLVVGALTALAIPHLAGIVGRGAALPIAVFVVALVVVSARGLPVLNNLLGYFLGLVAWFAAHLEPSFEALGQLFGASAIGSVAGWVSHHLPARVLQRA